MRRDELAHPRVHFGLPRAGSGGKGKRPERPRVTTDKKEAAPPRLPTGLHFTPHSTALSSLSSPPSRLPASPSPSTSSPPSRSREAERKRKPTGSRTGKRSRSVDLAVYLVLHHAVDLTVHLAFDVAVHLTARNMAGVVGSGVVSGVEAVAADGHAMPPVVPAPVVAVDPPVVHAVARPPMRWTSVKSGFVLRRICELVTKGARTEKGFKEVHVNQVAKMLKEFSDDDVTATQVYNHLRKWRQRWARVCKLKDLSGANWDEDTFTIVLHHDHYLGHIKDHPKDAELLNKPIENYPQMQVAFGSGVATGCYAMGSNELLGVFLGFGDSEATKVEGGDSPTGPDGADKKGAPDVGEASKATEVQVGGKRKRDVITEEESLIMTNMTEAVNNVAPALRESAPAHVDPELYDAVMGTAGFTEEALMAVLSYFFDSKA
ncbi:hypothetical protein EJB05_24225, partial [Eragrostis curvula]